MFSWDDLAFNLGGRVKSVLIVALAAFLVAQQGYRAGEGNNGRSGTVPSGSRGVSAVYEYGEDNGDNPIDEYFNGLKLNIKGTAEAVSFANIYLDSWEKELRRSYEVLGGVLAGESACGDSYIGEAQELFAGFAETQGWLEAYLDSSVSAVGSTDETGVLSARKAYGKAELTKWLTLRVYGLLAETLPQEGTGWDGGFGFAENEAGEALRGCGIY